MNEVRVLFFATLKDRAGLKETRMSLPEDATIYDLKQRLERQFPDLEGALDSALAAVNREYADESESLPQHAEVAFFPPVSGGSQPTVFSITDGSLDLDELLRRITLPSTGAACLFAGMVRAETERALPHRTEYLEYEAYKPMAEEKMRQVADEIRERWPSVEGIAIVQRVGRLYPGTPTVLIACTAAHRDTGVFDAARYGIDRLKEIVPVWKKEVSTDGEFWVEGEYRPERGE